GARPSGRLARPAVPAVDRQVRGRRVRRVRRHRDRDHRPDRVRARRARGAGDGARRAHLHPVRVDALARRPRGRAVARVSRALAAPLVLLAAWQLVPGIAGLDPLVLPTPSQIVAQLVATREIAWEHTLHTLLET